MSLQEDHVLYEALVDRTRSGTPVALATVVSARGSTPRKVGTKMLVDASGELVGTIGGGIGESEVVEAARAVLSTGEPRLVRIDLTDDMLSWNSAVCGGVMEVWVEWVREAG